jgi:hypothetical protein
MFKNRMLRKIFGSKRKELTRDKRKLHSGCVRDLYCWPNIIRMIKKNVMEGIYNTHEEQKCLSERDNLEDLSVEDRIIVRRISKKQDGGIDRIDLSQDRQVAGCCECDHELSGYIKCSEFLA